MVRAKLLRDLVFVSFSNRGFTRIFTTIFLLNQAPVLLMSSVPFSFYLSGLRVKEGLSCMLFHGIASWKPQILVLPWLVNLKDYPQKVEGRQNAITLLAHLARPPSRRLPLGFQTTSVVIRAGPKSGFTEPGFLDLILSKSISMSKDYSSYKNESRHFVSWVISW